MGHYAFPAIAIVEHAIAGALHVIHALPALSYLAGHA